MVVRTGATLPASVVSVVDAGSTMPVVCLEVKFGTLGLVANKYGLYG